MSKSIHVEFVENHTDEVLEELNEKLPVALEAIGMQAESYAKLLCPVDTGNLRNSITHDVDEETPAVIIGTNVEYAAYVEMGTSRQDPKPYLEPALADHIGEYEEILNEYLRQ